MTDKQPEALKWADAVECAHMPQLAEFLRTQHAAIERKDALLRQALELLENIHRHEDEGVTIYVGEEIEAITKEIAQ